MMTDISKPPVKLLFGNPELNGDGIQTTVRVGPKWRDIITKAKSGHRIAQVPVFRTGEENELLFKVEVTGFLFGSRRSHTRLRLEPFYAHRGRLRNSQLTIRLWS